MVNTINDRAPGSLPPVSGQEGERLAAVAEARLFPAGLH